MESGAGGVSRGGWRKVDVKEEAENAEQVKTELEVAGEEGEGESKPPFSADSEVKQEPEEAGGQTVKTEEDVKPSIGGAAGPLTGQGGDVAGGEGATASASPAPGASDSAPAPGGLFKKRRPPPGGRKK